MYTNTWTRSILLQKFRRAPHTLTHNQIKVHNIVIEIVIPPIFVQNVYVMYIKISYKYHRIPDTQSRVITKFYDFLGQPSYNKISIKLALCMYISKLAPSIVIFVV